MKPVVLYVDDERNNRTLVQLALAADFEVLLAEDGAEALKLLDGRKVHVLLADFLMPGMSGVELATEVRDRFPGIPRLIVTAYPEDATVCQACEDGIVAQILAKPWRRDALIETLRRAASERPDPGDRF